MKTRLILPLFILSLQTIEAQNKTMPQKTEPKSNMSIDQRMQNEKDALDKRREEKAKFPTKYIDPLNAVIRKLPNGLTFYLSVNKDEPRVQTYIAVKAGSKFDPSDNTGLAHYLEHMMFKGTHKYGTSNWEAEKALLDKISALYEKHKAEKDPEKKKAIYQEIDKASFEASKLAIPNEYDKMISSLGAKGTNAYTSNDQTVYVNDIPANELEKWMMVESERFQTLVLRLFHTELEAVYEEYNISQDNDRRWAYANLMKALYPNHPYGTQTTIGEGEHLKNPSMVNIHNYFNKYYVPNNIAICISGDIDVEQTTLLIEKYFSDWKSKDIKPFVQPTLPPIKAPIAVENFGPQDEFVFVGYRMPAANNKENLKLKMIDRILSNGSAGLIDLDIMQKQKLLSASSSYHLMHDHSIHALYGKPRAGQSLDEVRNILLEEIQKLKKGDFEDWMVFAAMNDIKVEFLKSLEANRNRAGAFVEAFTLNYEWKDYISQLDDMREITKADLVAFANKHYGNNYAVSYKRKGENNKPKVNKPKITPIVLNRDSSSGFAKNFFTVKSKDIDPVFIDLSANMMNHKFNPMTDVYYIPNQDNDLARYTMIYDGGLDNDLMYGLAGEYLKYLGTGKLTAEEFKKELFKLGLTVSYNVTRDRTTFSIFGLDENIDQGIELLKEHIATCKPDQKAFEEMVKDLIKQRQNAKTDKGVILRNMTNYAKFGPINPSTNIISEETLKSMNAEGFMRAIHGFAMMPVKIFFYGKKDIRQLFRGDVGSVQSVFSKPTNGAEQRMDNTYIPPIPNAIQYKAQENTGKQVLFYNYPGMVQAQIMLVSKGEPLNPANLSGSTLFADYFGGGLSSIVFQEIREQKAIAYSAYAAFTTPERKNDNHFLQAFVGTQSDKMETAMTEMLKLLNKMPRVEKQYENARNSTIKQIASDRITKENIFWRNEALKKMGFEKDFREAVYNEIKSTDIDKFEKFFNANIANKNFTYVILGDKTKINFEALKKVGEVKEMTPLEVFAY
ncbi:MAG: insulinase family protein [Chitinophagales bacterium]|nr:insulinase family protein [Chitinophagales bacterium]